MRLPKLAAAAVVVSSALVIQMPSAARAASAVDALEFHELLRSSVDAVKKDEKALSQIHMLPDAAILSALDANSAQEAVKIASQSSLEKLALETASQKRSAALDSDTILAKQPLTIVIVPGIFGEFIPTRGFEDVLSKPSPERDDFVAKVKAASAKADPNAADLSFDMPTNGPKSLSLDQVINMGSLKDSSGRTISRVILFKTPFMSLESMGDLKTHAGIFNRRLAKYLALTGPQKLAFVGYSRGTVLGLEMLAQAKAQNAPWLSDVKSMISLGGVAWGSALADDIDNQNSGMHAAIGAVKELRASLDPDSFERTFAAWLKFGASVEAALPRLLSHQTTPSSPDLKNPPVGSGMDGLSVLRLVKSGYANLGLNHPFLKFADNVRKFQRFLDEALSGVGSLTSKSREAWWQTHVLPQNVSYLAITGAMANPDAGNYDREVFDGPYGYSARSYDDLSLLQNRLDYESLSGLALNDSQVSVPQASFLPNAITKLNPANAGLKTEFLGTVGTHHWGLALRVVNAMKDGRVNPFPREALLKALAAKVALDASRAEATPIR